MASNRNLLKYGKGWPKLHLILFYINILTNLIILVKVKSGFVR